jgi:hypothetical protein
MGSELKGFLLRIYRKQGIRFYKSKTKGDSSFEPGNGKNQLLFKGLLYNRACGNAIWRKKNRGS